jgi:pyrroline-5-carboxylate reductase
MRHGFIGYGNVIRALHKALSNSRDDRFGYFSKTNSHKELVPFCSVKDLVDNSDVIWLGVKPQNLQDVLNRLKIDSPGELLADKLVVSVVAGKSIGYIENELGENIPIIRIMTNLAIEFGCSVTAYTSNCIFNRNKESVRNLLGSLGVLVEIPECDFNRFTAIFGSGPAFLLKFIDIMRSKMAGSGIDEAGLNSMFAGLLRGTSRYYSAYCNDLTIDRLIENIASKGGTTEAGINYMVENNVEVLFDNVIEIAQNRALHL